MKPHHVLNSAKGFAKLVEGFRKAGEARGLRYHILVTLIRDIKKVVLCRHYWRDLPIAFDDLWRLDIICGGSVHIRDCHLETRILWSVIGSVRLMVLFSRLDKRYVLILVKFFSFHDVLEELLSMTSDLGARSCLDMVLHFFPFFPVQSKSYKNKKC